MRPLVDVEAGLLREALQADVALIGPLAGVRARVYLQVLLAGEGGGTRQALERSALDWCPIHTLERRRASKGASRPRPTEIAARTGRRSPLTPLQICTRLASRGRGAGRMIRERDKLKLQRFGGETGVEAGAGGGPVRPAGSPTCVRPFMYIEARLLREALETRVALIGPLACMRAHVSVQVGRRANAAGRRPHV